MLPIAIVRAAGQEESYLEWMVFTTIVISGIGMILQANRFGRIGAGHFFFLATSGAFIPVSITALVEGGPSTLATLIVLSSPVNFLVSACLPLLRRIITPVVAGTMLMLIGAAFTPAAFEVLGHVPEDESSAAVLATAGATLLTIVMLMLRGRGVWRLWTLVIGVSVGCVVSAFFGLYDLDLIKSADWVGLPSVSAWPGFDLSVGARSWTLLSVFLLVTFANTIKTIGGAILVEQTSWRTARPVGYRTVQGSLNSDGVTNMLCGFAGVPPSTSIAESASFISFIGVAARRVGMLTGLLFIVVAFLPKLMAPLLAIPNPVVGALLLTLGVLIFMQGAKIVFQEGIDLRIAVIVGLSLWLGIGFQSNLILPHLFTGALHIVFGNGVMTGGMTSLLLTGFLWLTSPRPKKLRVGLNNSSMSEIDRFLNDFASSIGWEEPASGKLRAAGEEALTALVNLHKESGSDEARELLILARRDEDLVEVELISGPSSGNLEVRLSNLAERPDTEQEEDISLRLLRHYATSVRHRNYHNVDILSMRIEPT